MKYIMRRTQLYLEDDLWKALHARPRSLRTSVSELVRQTVRERYFDRLDVLIEVARGRDAGILARWEELAGSDHVLLCSPVSVAELWHGARPREHEAPTNLFRVLTCVPADVHTGLRAGAHLRQYRESHGVELGDALIGSAALLNGAALWTRNRMHYPMKDLSFY